MIRSISGKVGAILDNAVVVDVHGVGLKVYMHSRSRGRLTVGSDARLCTHLVVREDALDLYGFESEEELRFFELLISVGGVGPKSALSVLEVSDIKSLSAAIVEGRPDVLTRASGIGRKTAERIVLELKGKVQSEKSEGMVKTMEADADLVETLVGLGYRRDQAKAALTKVDAKVTDLQARLRAALKVLSGK